MKTILEAIQQYPEQFIDTCRARASTTPNVINKSMHLQMAIAIECKLFNKLKSLLEVSEYQKPLDGVITCLTQYSDMDHETFWKIFELLEEGKIV